MYLLKVVWGSGGQRSRGRAVEGETEVGSSVHYGGQVRLENFLKSEKKLAN